MDSVVISRLILLNQNLYNIFFDMEGVTLKKNTIKLLSMV